MVKQLSNGHNYYGPDLLGELYDGFTNTKGWLYADGYTENKLKAYNILRNVPVFSNYMDYLLDNRSDAEYLRRYGMSYSDIHDPRKLRSTSSGSSLVGSSINFVSHNVSRLYK